MLFINKVNHLFNGGLEKDQQDEIVECVSMEKAPVYDTSSSRTGPTEMINYSILVLLLPLSVYTSYRQIIRQLL